MRTLLLALVSAGCIVLPPEEEPSDSDTGASPADSADASGDTASATGTETDIDTDTAPEAGTDSGPGTDTSVDTVAEPIVVADSAAEFSGVQGHEGWYYGYIEPGTSLEWVPMPTYVPGGNTPGWYSQPELYWTTLAGNAAHPNGQVTSQGRSSAEQWAVRRWVSDETGRLTVTSHIAKVYADALSNGVDARIVVDGVQVYGSHIDGTDTEGIDISVDIDVAEGSTVDFVLDPHESQDFADRTLWTIVITK